MTRASRVELLTLGEAFEDLVFLDLERLPNAGEEIKTSRFVRTVGGGAVITAVAAVRLGMPTETWSGLGDAAVKRIRAEGITVRNLKRRDEEHAISAALSTATNRTFVTYNGVNDELEERLLARVSRITQSHAHFAFYPRDCGGWLPIISALQRRGISTSWDFGWNERLLADDNFERLLRQLDFIFLNEQEAALYAQRRTLDRALKYWSTYANTVIIKVGPEGSRWISRTVELHEPAPRVNAVDTTGAGDAFNGGFLVGSLRGLPPKTCLRIGNRVGALSTRKAGGLDALPSAAELPAALLGSRAVPARPRTGR